MKKGKMRHIGIVVALALLGSLSPGWMRAQTAAPAGMFEGHSDIGAVLHPGSIAYDASEQTYTVAGSGENMWSSADAFQFAWK